MFNQKRRFFKNKVKQVQRATWDLEFKISKVRDMRESARRQIDRCREAIDALNAQLLKENTEDTKKILNEKLSENNQLIEKLVAQIEVLDARVNGLGTPEFAKYPEDKQQKIISQLEPNEYSGILAQIEAGVELIDMYKDFIKHNT